jgi:hypothetical protein
MTGIRVILATLAVALIGSVSAADLPGENMIDVKITLPKGDTYLRGASDPVADLIVEMTLTNKTAKEDLNKETITVPTVKRVTGEELADMASQAAEGKMTSEQQMEKVKAKTGTESRDQYKVNQNSTGYAYAEPNLNAHDNIDFIITRIPEEGEVVPENAKPKPVIRDNKAENVNNVDVSPVKYLAAGETTPAFILPVGRYYVIREPGMYSIKAVLKEVGDNSKGAKHAESNEEKFRVLPFKIVTGKIEEVQENWEHYERGIPNFDYMLYQVKTSGQFDEVWAVQRIPVRRVDRWEWTRVCTVKAGTQVQIAQINPKKVALLAVHHKNDAGIYTIDFSVAGPKIDVKTMDAKEGLKLKVDGGNASAE